MTAAKLKAIEEECRYSEMHLSQCGQRIPDDDDDEEEQPSQGFNRSMAEHTPVETRGGVVNTKTINIKTT